MKSVINSATGQVLFAIQNDEQIDLKPEEEIIDGVCDLPYDPEIEIQVCNVESKTFMIQPK